MQNTPERARGRNERTVAEWMGQSMSPGRPANVPGIPDWSRFLQASRDDNHGRNCGDGGVQGIDWGCEDNPGNSTARGDHGVDPHLAFADNPARGFSFAARSYTEHPARPDSKPLPPSYQQPASGAASSAMWEPPANSNRTAGAHQREFGDASKANTPPPSGPNSPHATLQNGSFKAKGQSAAMSAQPSIPEQSPANQEVYTSARRSMPAESPSTDPRSPMGDQQQPSDSDSPWMPRTHALRRIIGEIGIEVPNGQETPKRPAHPTPPQPATARSQPRSEKAAEGADPSIVLL